VIYLGLGEGRGEGKYIIPRVRTRRRKECQFSKATHSGRKKNDLFRYGNSAFLSCKWTVTITSGVVAVVLFGCDRQQPMDGVPSIHGQSSAVRFRLDTRSRQRKRPAADETLNE
jgi:hypothetical protein